MFDWTAYLELAQELAHQGTQSPNDEAKLRSAVSRAYYAAYCTARNRLRDKDTGQVPRGTDAHSFVWDCFSASPDDRRKRIGESGQRLRRDRNSADYDDVVTKLPLVLAKALIESRQILDLLSQLS